MANWFVDGTNGSDANDGTTAATGGGHGPFATIGKLIAAGGAMANGDKGYVAPKEGGYRESITIGITPTAEIKIIGDVHKSQAWAASTPNGPVIWSGWTTDDYSSPSNNAQLIYNGKNFITLEDFWILSGSNPAALDALSVTGSHDLTLRRCVIQARITDTVFGFSYKCTVAVDPNLLFDKCIFVGGSSCFSIDAPLHTGDYAVTATFNDCLFYGNNTSNAARFESTSAGAGKPLGPVLFNHCTFAGQMTNAAAATNSNWKVGSVKLYSNLIPFSQINLTSGGTAGMFVTDDNRVVGNASIPGTNGSGDLGGGSTNSMLFPPMFEIGQSALWALQPKPFLSPWPGAPGNGSFVQEAVASSAADLYSRPRPSGGGRVNTTASVTGTATSGAATTLTDSGATWTTNAFAGYVIRITSGTGNGQRRWIKSNTGTVATISYAWTTNPDNTSVYSIDPPGFLKAPGCYEAHDAALLGGSANADGATGNCLEILGPGDVRVRIAVPASATTITVKVKWDANHADTNKPRAIMLWQPAIGIDDAADTTLKYHEIKTATGTAGSGYETLTFSAITPTAVGYVYILLQSRSAKGHGIAYFDTWGGV